MTIAGVIYSDEIPSESVTKKMLLSSPNFHDIWRDRKIELGSAFARQKGQNLALPFRILFDGYLYEIDAIDKEIQCHYPHSVDLTLQEKLAALFSIHQEESFSFLNGNFVLAIYDLKKQELILARDRLGEKGLYWALNDQYFLFANSLKSILASKLISQAPDLEAISFFLSFGFIPQERSPIQGVFKLQPGHYLKISKDKDLLIHSYWSYNSHLNKKRTDFSEKDLKIAISQSWKTRSSNQMAICYGIKDPLLEQEAGIPLQFIQPETPLTAESVFLDLHSMIWHLEEPVADLSLPGLWHLCKQLRNQHQSELFFTTGSLSFLKQQIHTPRLFSFKTLSSLEHMLKQRILVPLLHRLHPSSSYKMLRSIHTHPWHIAFLNQTALFNKEEFYDLHSHLLQPVNKEIFLHRFPALNGLGPSLSSLLYLYHKIKLPTAVLLPQERFCSHFDLVIKTPYLDKNVVELIANIPDSNARFSFGQIFTPSSETSRITPLPSWATNSTHQWIEKLSKSVLVEAGLFSPHWLSEQMKNFNRHPHLFFQELWGLLVLEVWFRLFIENKSQDVSIEKD